jgi:hypothetical protein
MRYLYATLAFLFAALLYGGALRRWEGDETPVERARRGGGL